MDTSFVFEGTESPSSISGRRMFHHNSLQYVAGCEKRLPLITEEQMEMFYSDGEFEAAVLADFNKDADRIDLLYGL